MRVVKAVVTCVAMGQQVSLKLGAIIGCRSIEVRPHARIQVISLTVDTVCRTVTVVLWVSIEVTSAVAVAGMVWNWVRVVSRVDT